MNLFILLGFKARKSPILHSFNKFRPYPGRPGPEYFAGAKAPPGAGPGNSSGAKAPPGPTPGPGQH